MSQVDRPHRRAALRLLGLGVVGSLVVTTNPDTSFLASLAPSEPIKDAQPQNSSGNILAPRLAQAAGLAPYQDSVAGSDRISIISEAAERGVEFKDGEKPAKINFELRVITRGTASAMDTYYKVQGNDKDTFYLYKVINEQLPQSHEDGRPFDPNEYRRNTEVVAKFTRSGQDSRGDDVWDRQALKQPTVVIEGKANEDSCNTECLMTSVFVSEVDSNAKPFEGAVKGNGYKNIKFIPGQVCDEWGNWGYNHLAPTPTPIPTEVPTAVPTATRPNVRTEQLPPPTK